MITHEQLAVSLKPNDCQVLLRPLHPGRNGQCLRLAGRLASLTDSEVEHETAQLLQRFRGRHHLFDEQLLERSVELNDHLPGDRGLSQARKILLGALITGEYTPQSAALFNPSIVPHPDQSGLGQDETRFVMSARMTGEGHISSLCFSSGVLEAGGQLRFEPPATVLTAGLPEFNDVFDSRALVRRLKAEDIDRRFIRILAEHLPKSVAAETLLKTLDNLREHSHFPLAEVDVWIGMIREVIQENYTVTFAPERALEERVLFPSIPQESNGIEDVRFTYFQDDAGDEPIYHATYTAYDGREITPRLLSTSDFVTFSSHALYGDEAIDKGMALFPRKINGLYAMLSRQDGEALYLMYSDDLYHWDNRERIMRPCYAWELLKIGNCGAPIETSEGWLVLTHGVGPFRIYSIGAVLLDKEDPSRIIGRLPEPLLSGNDHDACGYVPNVVYTCGSMIHGDRLVVPYGVADQWISFASFDLKNLLAELIRQPPS